MTFFMFSVYHSTPYWPPCTDHHYTLFSYLVFIVSTYIIPNTQMQLLTKAQNSQHDHNKQLVHSLKTGSSFSQYKQKQHTYCLLHMLFTYSTYSNVVKKRKETKSSSSSSNKLEIENLEVEVTTSLTQTRPGS